MSGVRSRDSQTTTRKSQAILVTADQSLFSELIEYLLVGNFQGQTCAISIYIQDNDKSVRVEDLALMYITIDII